MDENGRGGYTLVMARCFAKTVAVWVVGLLMTSLPQISYAVLCVGADGHVAIEANTAGLFNDCDTHQHDDETTDEPSQLRHEECVKHCGACNDYTLSLNNAHPSPHSAGAAAAPTFFVGTAPDVYRDCLYSGQGTISKPVSRAPPIANGTLRSLRTVVITC